MMPTDRVNQVDNHKVINSHENMPASSSASGNSLNYATRWVENARYTGTIPQALYYYRENHTHDDYATPLNDNFELEIGSILQNGGGLFSGLLLHYFLRNQYNNTRSLNPLYRNFKTLASIGTTTGMILSNILPLPTHGKKFVAAIITDVCSLGLGAFSIPYWLVRAYAMKPATPESPRNYYTKIGAEGWSKYTKTFLVFGTVLGQIAGAIYAFSSGANLLLSMGLVGGIVGVTACVVGLIAVPVINKLTGRVLITEDKNKFRNNYIRSGITFGTGLGASIGFAIGTFLFPGVGSTAGMLLGGAIGAAIGGSALGILGKKITTRLQDKWSVKTDTENSWDYATRNMSYMFSFACATIGFFLPVPGGAAMGAALGAAVGTAIGWGFGLTAIRLARKAVPEEKNAKSLPWTQRVASGATITSILGAAIGFGIGCILGPAGALTGATLGASIGGCLGGAIGAVSDQTSREVIKKIVKNKPDDKPIQPAVPEVINPPVSTHALVTGTMKAILDEDINEIESMIADIDRNIQETQEKASLPAFETPVIKRPRSTSVPANKTCHTSRMFNHCRGNDYLGNAATAITCGSPR